MGFLFWVANIGFAGGAAGAAPTTVLQSTTLYHQMPTLP